MAEVKDGCLIIMEGDIYEQRGDTLVFIRNEVNTDGDRCFNSERKESD